MHKVTKDNLAYYFENVVVNWYNRTFSDQLPLSMTKLELMQPANFVIDTNTDSIVKSRHQLEILMDRYCDI
jgi:hypothetical protein